MSLQPGLAVEALLQQVIPGSRLLHIWPLRGGISTTMTALEVQLPSGENRKMVLRQPDEAALRKNPRAAAEEFCLLQALQALLIAAPAPLYLDPPVESFSAVRAKLPHSAVLPRRMLIEYIDGESDFAPPDPGAAAQKMAEQLAQIHRAVQVDNAAQISREAQFFCADLSFLPKINACAELPDQRQEMPTSPAHQRPNQGSSLFGGSHLSAPLQEMKAWMTAAQPMAARNIPTLLHGDFWPGNILWRQGNLIAVIDWEDAHIGDPLSDLAIARLDLLILFSSAAMAAFTSRYQALNTIDFTSMPYWDLCAALRLDRLVGGDPAGWAAFYHPYGRADISEETIRAHFCAFVNQALEKTAE